MEFGRKLTAGFVGFGIGMGLGLGCEAAPLKRFEEGLRRKLNGFRVQGFRVLGFSG